MWKYKTGIKPKKLIDELVVSVGTKKEYSKLKKFHYINKDFPAGGYQIFSLKHNGVLYGITVYSPPILELLARNKTHIGKAMNVKFGHKSAKYKFLNKNFRTTSRVIIHPSLRGIGCASYLSQQTWRKVGVRFIEAIGAMLYFRNFFPKPYSYYIKVSRKLSATTFFDTKSPKGASMKRLKTPVQRYGYVLYINENEPIRY